ncbi:MAG: DUF1318 domain-containing protein [Pseudomonadota bacterium]
MKILLRNSWTIALTLTFVICLAPKLFARSLKSAKREGLVTEQSSGYLKGKGSKGQTIASEINQKRQQEYRRIAKDTGVPEAAVARKAGEKLKGK